MPAGVEAGGPTHCSLAGEAEEILSHNMGRPRRFSFIRANNSSHLEKGKGFSTTRKRKQACSVFMSAGRMAAELLPCRGEVRWGRLTGLTRWFSVPDLTGRWCSGGHKGCGIRPTGGWLSQPGLPGSPAKRSRDFEADSGQVLGGGQRGQGEQGLVSLCWE